MTLNEKLDVVENILKGNCHYKGRRDPGYYGPHLDYVRNTDSVDVFSEHDVAFYWADLVADIVNALGLSQYINYDCERKCVFSHIYG